MQVEKAENRERLREEGTDRLEKQLEEHVRSYEGRVKRQIERDHEIEEREKLDEHHKQLELEEETLEKHRETREVGAKELGSKLGARKVFCEGVWREYGTVMQANNTIASWHHNPL